MQSTLSISVTPYTYIPVPSKTKLWILILFKQLETISYNTAIILSQLSATRFSRFKIEMHI